MIGALGANKEWEVRMRLKEELDILDDFAALIVLETRSAEGGRATNSLNYAEQVISSVRGHYTRIQGRIPGMADGALGKKLSYILRGLPKMAPCAARVKLPILKGDLRNIRGVLRLEVVTWIAHYGTYGWHSGREL